MAAAPDSLDLDPALEAASLEHWLEVEDISMMR
jgi:hypothetical protein